MEKSEETKAVEKAADAATAVTDDKDEKGVPWKNRAAEFQRKLEDSQKEIENLRSRATEAKTTPSESDVAEAKKQEIVRMVEMGPDAYFEQKRTEWEWKKEFPQAEDWLRTQGMTEDERPLIRKIIEDHGISAPSPMLRAKAAWKILRAEKLEKEFASQESDKKREDSVKSTMPDSGSRSTATKTGPKRAELLAELRDVSKKGDRFREAELLDQLSDVRE